MQIFQLMCDCKERGKIRNKTIRHKYVPIEYTIKIVWTHEKKTNKHTCKASRWN